MKKLFVSITTLFIFLAVPVFAKTAAPAKPKAPAAWKAAVPKGYAPITWAKAPGIASFFKAPSGNGSLDFITRINLAQNQVQFIASSSAPVDYGAEATGTLHNYAFERFVAEAGKTSSPQAKFVWNGPFFNATVLTSDLSLAIKTSVGTSTLISSGSRPLADMFQPRRMLMINNQTAKASIQDFDDETFASSTADQILEGFAPTVPKADSPGGLAARLFIGVSANGRELIIYCSQGATVAEASDALATAGAEPQNQLQADGGGSATCGYNLPGQFFVEPARTLPVLMGAVTIMARGSAIPDGLNVRIGPGTKNPIVAKLLKNAPVRVFEEKSGWYRIGNGQWVFKSLIKKS